MGHLDADFRFLSGGKHLPRIEDDKILGARRDAFQLEHRPGLRLRRRGRLLGSFRLGRSNGLRNCL